MADLLERLQAALADRYAVESEIGRGGMATVFLAEDLKHGRQVAIKVLHPELAAAVGPDRFLREIEAVAGLTHPHVLPLFDSGEAEGLLFYVMPYVAGESLRQRLDRERQLPVEDAVRIAQHVAEALDHAHRHSLIHRDIKPGNILLEEGHAVVTDFGVARAINDAGGEKVTATGMAVGTLAYMSPEQAAGQEVDERSDVYALGCVLYEMLAGEPPWDAPTPQAILARKAVETVPDLRVHRKSVPDDLEAVIAKAMAPIPADRFSSANLFADALKAPERMASASRQRIPRRLVGAGVAIVLVVASIWLARLFIGAGPAEGELDPDAIAVLPFRAVATSDAVRTAGRDIPELFWIKVTGDYGARTVDPGTVTQLWTAAGGTVEMPLAEVQGLEIARAVGAGRLVTGVLAGTEENMSITATLLEVPTGRVRVRQTTVEGPQDEYLRLVDRLITQLLAKDYGEAAHRLPQLASHRPEAVQAYLRAKAAWSQLEWARAQRLDRQALEADSTFILAAVAAYEHGANDVEAARYAWERQNHLSVRDRAILRGGAGWLFGETRTVEEQIAQFDSAGLPDWETEALACVHEFGRLADIPRWRERDRTGLERWVQVEPDNVYPARFLFDLAADDGDTAAMRRYAEELERRASSPVALGYALGYRLRLAMFTGDAAGARRLWKEAAALADTAASAFNYLEAFDIVLLDGYGLEELDRFSSTVLAKHLDRLEYAWAGMRWARSRGRYSDWVTFRDAHYARLTPLDAAVLRLRDALFLGEPRDSTVRAAAQFLDQVADGIVEATLPARDPTPDIRNLALARCWSTLWKVAHGNTEGAPAAVRYLRDEVPLPYRWSVCAGLIEVLLAEQESDDLRSSVLHLDSVVRPVPMEAVGGWSAGDRWISRDGTHFIDNLVLARRLVPLGDTAGALAAARRARPWQSFLWFFDGGVLFVDLLREEARLAAMVGDTASAIEAYEHWLKLRDTRPENARWAAQWDSMRVEYAALTEIEGRR